MQLITSTDELMEELEFDCVKVIGRPKINQKLLKVGTGQPKKVLLFKILFEQKTFMMQQATLLAFMIDQDKVKNILKGSLLLHEGDISKVPENHITIFKRSDENSKVDYDKLKKYLSKFFVDKKAYKKYEDLFKKKVRFISSKKRILRMFDV